MENRDLFVISLLGIFFIGIIFFSGCISLTHGECNEENQCIQVNGSGSNECSVDSDCTHLKCDGAVCKLIDGPGDSNCKDDNDCKHLECIDGSCKKVIGPGDNECTNNSECMHYDCIDGSCKLILEPGQDKCTTDENCTEEETHMECTANEECVEVLGAGNNSCESNADCVKCIPDCEDKECGDDGCNGTCGTCETGFECTDFTCVEIPTHKECINEQCVPVEGEGDDSCTSDEECIECSGTEYLESEVPAGKYLSGTCEDNCDAEDYYYNSGDQLCYWDYFGHSVRNTYGDSCIWSNKESCDSEERCTASGCTCGGEKYLARPQGTMWSGKCSDDCDSEDYYYNDGKCYWTYTGYGENGAYGDSCIWDNWVDCSSATNCTASGCTDTIE